MRKKKTFYNYWELPDWKDVEILVAHKFIHNDKQKLLLRNGDNDYTITMPKSNNWSSVKVGERILVTKQRATEKRAILRYRRIKT